MDVVIAPVVEVGDTVELGDLTYITTNGLGSEPVFFPGGERLAYYQKTGTPGEGATMVVHLESGDEFQFSEWSGCAHGTVNYSGTRFFCQDQHQLSIRDLEDDSWSELETGQFPELDLADFPGCDDLSYAHPQYCGDDEHILVTVSCLQDSIILSAELVLLSWNGRNEGEVSAFIGRLAAEEFGSDNSDSYVGSCLADSQDTDTDG